MAGLTLQQKLALAHTSLSQRIIAAYMGVSPRTIGRWLREGMKNGVRKIPREAANAVNFVYAEHRRECETREREAMLPPRDPDSIGIAALITNELGIPFYKNAIALAIRKPLDNGLLGNRVFIQGAQFIDSALRLNIIAGLVARGNFVTGTILSDVVLSLYYADSNSRMLDEIQNRRLSKNQKQAMVDRSFEKAFGVDTRNIALNNEVRTIATKKNVGLNVLIFNIETNKWEGLTVDETARQIAEMERQYIEKHEASSVIGAHTIILQLREVYARGNQPIANKPVRKTAANSKRKRKT